jgi:hypothetical protein
MLADTAVIHAFGDAQARHGAALAAIGTALASAHPATDALGTAGARFTGALADAVRRHAERAARLGGLVADAATAAHANAVAYVDTDAGSGHAIAGLGV